MLDAQSAETAIDLTVDTAGRDIMLAAVPDTPLALLCRTTPLELTDRKDDSVSAAAAEMVELTRGEEHAGVLAHVVTMAAESVRRTMDLARNTTMPHIRRVLDSFQEKMSLEAQMRSPYNVLPAYLHEVFKTDTAERLLSGYLDIIPQTLEGNPFFGKFAPEELRELVRVTNDGEFNELIDELLTANNGAVLAEVTSALEGMTNYKRVSPEAAICLVVILKNLDMPKEGVSTSLSQYNSDREIFVSNVGKVAALQISRVTHSTKHDVLYPVTGNADANTIGVNGEVYAKMLASGLTVEAVIGNELLGRRYRGVQMVTPEAIADMTAAYNRDKSIRQQAHEVRLVQITRKAVLDALRADQVYVTGEANEVQVVGDDATRSWIRLRDYVDGIYSGPANGTQPEIIIASAICAVWYGHTDVGRVISAMMVVEKSNPALESREVATLATLRYIADWVASQITTVNAD